MKLLKLSLGALMALVVFSAPFASYAAVDRVVMEGFISGYPNTIFSVGHYMDGTVEVENLGLIIPLDNLHSGQDMMDTATSLSIAHGQSQGYTAIATSTVIWPTPDDRTIDSRIAAATSSLSLPQAMSFGTTTRSLNSAFQVSASRAAFVSYTVDVATTLSLTGGATGTVTLQYADDSGFTTNVKTVQSSVNGNTGTLTIGLALTQTGTAALTGIIPAGKYVKIVTANTAGTPTFTYRAAQEVLLPSN